MCIYLCSILLECIILIVCNCCFCIFKLHRWIIVFHCAGCCFLSQYTYTCRSKWPEWSLEIAHAACFCFHFIKIWIVLYTGNDCVIEQVHTFFFNFITAKWNGLLILFWNSFWNFGFVCYIVLKLKVNLFVLYFGDRYWHDMDNMGLYD